VVIDDLDVLGVSGLPYEADTKLLVHPDTVLARAISLERLELVSRRDTKITKLLGRVECQKLAERHVIEIGEFPASFASEHLLGFLAAEALDHTLKVLRTTYWIERNGHLLSVTRTTDAEGFGVPAKRRVPFRVQPTLVTTGGVL